MLGKCSIREFRFFSDLTAALTSIFDPRPHPSQQASLLFRLNMHRLFSERKDITGNMLWTPGHGGLEHMNITDKKARNAANHKVKESGYLLLLFVSRSAAVTEVETMALKDWNEYLNKLEDNDEKIFRPQGDFFPFAQQRKSSTFMKLRPAKWFKSITRKPMSQLTQMCTNHAPTVRTDLANRPTEPMLVSFRARYTKLRGNRGFLQSGSRQTTPVRVGVTCGSGISAVRVDRE